MQSPERACAMLEEQLGDGCVGVEIGTSAAGRRLDQAEFEPFWDAAERLGQPVTLHPAYTEGVNPALAPYYLENVLGYLFDTTITIERLLCAGTLERHPDLRLVLLHGGGYFPYQAGRLRHARTVRAELAGAPADPWAHLDQLNFDPITHDAAALRFLIERVGPERVVMGTDLPFDMALEDPIGTLLAATDERTAVAIAERNPRRSTDGSRGWALARKPATAAERRRVAPVSRAVIPPSPPAVDGLGRGARRAAVITILAAVMALGIMPMVAVGVIAPLLIDDLGISRADIGILVGVVAGVSALLSPLVGGRVDRVGDRTALLAVLAAGTLALALMAAAFDYASMAVALAVAGVCRAGCNPATNRLIRVRLAPGARGWVTGIKQSGEALAIVVVASALPALAALWDWRVALAVLSGLTAATLIAARFLVAGSRSGGVSRRDSEDPRLRGSTG